MWPQRRQPTRLPRPWDSPGKNTAVGCHFLLQCIKVKSESEVSQCVWPSATPWTAAFQTPPSMGFSWQEYWNGVPLPSPLSMATILLLTQATITFPLDWVDLPPSTFTLIVNSLPTGQEKSQIFSSILRVVFLSHLWFPLLCKAFKFNYVPFVYFSFLLHYPGRWIKKILLQFMSNSVSAYVLF